MKRRMKRAYVLWLIRELKDNAWLSDESLIARLGELGVSGLERRDLVEWSHAGLIPSYVTYYQPKIRAVGRPRKDEKNALTPRARVIQNAKAGRQFMWPPRTLAYAAAVWAVPEAVPKW